MNELPRPPATVSAPGEDLVARGGTADVLAWGDDQVLKLYREGSPPGCAEHEAGHARAAHDAGVRTPAVSGVIRHGNRDGVVFERVRGPTLLQALAEQPDHAAAFARQLATTHAAVHRCTAPSLPPLRSKLEAHIARAAGLDENHRDAALAAVARLPDGNALCHHDFQPGNIILSAAGPVVIDWYDAGRGDPLADVARTALLLLCATPRHMPTSGELPGADARGRFCTAYLDRYAGLRSFAWEELTAWIAPVAAARLAEPVPAAERVALTALVQKGILGPDRQALPDRLM